MSSYITRHIWEDLSITKPYTRWIAERVLRIPPELINEHRSDIASLIYRVFFGLTTSENKYITAFNSARADLVAEYINPSSLRGRAISIESEPDGDPSYWLASHVIGFADIEISALCGIDIDDVECPGKQLIPLLKKTHRLMKAINVNDPLLNQFHKSRYLLIRYYLDAVYHEI